MPDEEYKRRYTIARTEQRMLYSDVNCLDCEGTGKSKVKYSRPCPRCGGVGREKRGNAALARLIHKGREECLDRAALGRRDLSRAGVR